MGPSGRAHIKERDRLDCVDEGYILILKNLPNGWMNEPSLMNHCKI